MSGIQTTCYQHLEFSGHLIDSLTLSKIIDRVQELGGDYHLNDVQIGDQKRDVSSVNLTLYASDEAKLQELSQAIAPYGGVPVAQQNTSTTPVTATDIVPEEAFRIKLPQRIRHQGQWLELGSPDSLVIVVEGQQARLEKISRVPAGAQVVSGTQGIEW